MNIIKPNKLNKHSHIRVIAPSRSLSIVSKENVEYAQKRLNDYGFTVSFGKHVFESDRFRSSSIQSRVEDLHDAFLDTNVDCVLTAIGGYNSNQILDYIDYDLIKNNPKIICGFSDITALNNAIYSQTGLITYLGPHFSTFGMEKGFEYTFEMFIRTFILNNAYDVASSKEWSDDPWYIDQENRLFNPNPGYYIINHGDTVGATIGGHLRCITSLQGTKYWNDLSDSILFIEDDAEINAELFDRGVQSIIHQKNSDKISGILIGRFQNESKITNEAIYEIIKSKKELDHIPVIAGVDFGHTTPILTFPIGGTCAINTQSSNPIKFLEF